MKSKSLPDAIIGIYRILPRHAGPDVPLSQLVIGAESCELTWFHRELDSARVMGRAEGAWRIDGEELTIWLGRVAGTGPGRQEVQISLTPALIADLEAGSSFDTPIRLWNRPGRGLTAELSIRKIDDPVTDDRPESSSDPPGLLGDSSGELVFRNNLKGKQWLPQGANNWTMDIGDGAVTVVRQGSSCCSRTKSISAGQVYRYTNDDSNCDDETKWQIQVAAANGTPEVVTLTLKPGDDIEFYYKLPNPDVPQVDYYYSLNGREAILGYAAQGQVIG